MICQLLIYHFLFLYLLHQSFKMQKIEDVILFQVDLTSKISKHYSQREFDKQQMGITVEQWIILKIVSESSALSQKELADKSYRDPASIARTINLLEKKELVRRKDIPSNKRMYNIALTKQGRAFVQNHLSIVEAHRKKSIDGISEEELAQLGKLLRRIRRNMS